MARVLARLAHSWATWLTRTLCTFALALALVRPEAWAAPQMPTLAAQLPTISARSQRAALSGDLSAGVRIHRGGRSLDVWLVTPHSMHWALAATAPPLHKQIAALNWPLAGTGKFATPAARFERLSLPPRSAPRLLRTLA